jgi:tetratricopeptide (TPR) repeat protein
MREAEDAFRRVVEALRPAAAGEKAGLHGLPLAFAASGLTALYSEQGRFEEAHAFGEESLRVAESLNHTYTLVFALRTFGHLHTIEGRIEEAVMILERGRALSDDTSLRSLAPNLLASLGYAYTVGRAYPGPAGAGLQASLGYAQALGRHSEGARMLEQAMEALEQFGQSVWYSVVLYQLSEAWLLAGDLARARQCAERAHALAVERGERAFEAQALRMLGAVTARSTPLDVDAARRHYASALQLAEERCLRPLSAHCHAGLASLYERSGEPDRAAEHRATALEISGAIGMVLPPELSAR